MQIELNCIGLHDKRISAAKIEGEWLTLFFENGFDVLPDKKEWISRKKGEMSFHMIDQDVQDISMYYIRSTSKGKKIMEDISAGWIQQLNNKQFELEIISKLQGDNQLLLQGYLWKKRKPYHYDFQLQLSYDQCIVKYEL